MVQKSIFRWFALNSIKLIYITLISTFSSNLTKTLEDKLSPYPPQLKLSQRCIVLPSFITV